MAGKSCLSHPAVYRLSQKWVQLDSIPYISFVKVDSLKCFMSTENLFDNLIVSYATQAKKSWFPLIGIQSHKTTHLRISEFLSLTLLPLGPGRPSGPWKPYKIDKGECHSSKFSQELFFVSSSRIDCCSILKRISLGPSWILSKYGSGDEVAQSFWKLDTLVYEDALESFFAKSTQKRYFQRFVFDILDLGCVSGIQRVVMVKSWKLNYLIPKIKLLILPSSCYIFPCKLVTRIWC